MTADVIRRAAAALRTRSAEAGQRYDGQVVLTANAGVSIAGLLDTLANVEESRPGNGTSVIEDIASLCAAAILRGQS